jgi:hypothetical protein
MEVENLMETDEDGLKMMTILHTALKSRQVTSYHLIPTSCHLIIEGGKNNRYPLDFTSISKENFNFIFIK